MDHTNNNSTDQRENLWKRSLYMLLFAFAFGISETVLYLLAIASLLYRAIYGRNNSGLQHFGKNLGLYVRQLSDYLSFNSNETPFPFTQWPSHQTELREERS